MSQNQVISLDSHELFMLLFIAHWIKIKYTDKRAFKLQIVKFQFPTPELLRD